MQRFTKEKKLWAVDQRLNKKRSFNSIADQLSIHKGTVRDWVNQFSSFGATAFDRKHNTHYSEELKNEAVRFYLDGRGSIFYLDGRGSILLMIMQLLRISLGL